MTLAPCTQSSDTSLLLPLVPDLSSFLLLHFLQELQGGRVLWFHFQQTVQIIHAGSDVLEFLVSLSPPIESLDIVAVNHQRLVTVSDGVSVLLH